MSPKLGRSSSATCTMSTTRRTTRFLLFDVSWDSAQRTTYNTQRIIHSAQCTLQYLSLLRIAVPLSSPRFPAHGRCERSHRFATRPAST
jgi:hypothetical protein